jgi:hypothetical protein
MSQQNVEIARRAIEAASHNPTPDFATMNELYDPAHEFISIADSLEGDRHIGALGYRDWLAGVRDVMAWESNVETIEAVDSERVIAVALMRAKGISSGIALGDQRIACVMTLRDGMVVRTVVYPSREDALHATELIE